MKTFIVSFIGILVLLLVLAALCRAGGDAGVPAAEAGPNAAARDRTAAARGFSPPARN